MNYDNMVYQLRKHSEIDRYEFVVYSPAVHIGGTCNATTVTLDELSDIVGDEFAGLFDSKQDRSYFACLRAKKIIRDIIYNNDWKYFFTQTFSSEFDRYSIDDTVKRFLSFLKDFNYHNHCRKGIEPVKYLFIPERHSDGAWHLHGLVSHFPDLIPYRKEDFSHLPMHIIKALQQGKDIYYHKSFTNRLGWCTFQPGTGHIAYRNISL